jgi:hypothetical protein
MIQSVGVGAGGPHHGLDRIQPTVKGVPRQLALNDYEFDVGTLQEHVPEPQMIDIVEIAVYAASREQM